MLPFLKVLKKALDYSRALKVIFCVCLNAPDKTYHKFLNLKSAGNLASFESF